MISDYVEWVVYLFCTRVITHNRQDQKTDKTKQSPKKQTLVTKLNIQKKARLEKGASR